MDRQHARVADALGDPLPTRAEEEADPAAADARYEDVVDRLRALTRPRNQFPLVFEENANYGQRRNLLGLRVIGACVAAVALVLGVVLFFSTHGTVATRASRYAPTAVTAVLLLGLWWKVVTPDWVRVPAEAYADQLFQAAEVLRRGK